MSKENWEHEHDRRARKRRVRRVRKYRVDGTPRRVSR